jgi:hypothetical protein
MKDNFIELFNSIMLQLDSNLYNYDYMKSCFDKDHNSDNNEFINIDIIKSPTRHRQKCRFAIIRIGSELKYALWDNGIYLSINLSINQSIYLFINLSIYLSIFIYIYQSVYLYLTNTNLSIYIGGPNVIVDRYPLSIYLSSYLFI